jgi:hypothetical protein
MLNIPSNFLLENYFIILKELTVTVAKRPKIKTNFILKKKNIFKFDLQVLGQQ